MPPLPAARGYPTVHPPASSQPHDLDRDPNADSPFQLLGRAIREACDDPAAPRVALHALVVYAVEHARLQGVAIADLMRALDGWIDIHTAGRDERTRWRVATTVRHWALAEYLACETQEPAVPPPAHTHTHPSHPGSGSR